MQNKNFTVELIPALKDNYIFALIDNSQKNIVIVDPGEAQPVLKFIAKHSLTLIAILITHHHWDHTNGIEDIIKKHPASVFGPKDEVIPALTNPLSDNDHFELNHFPEFEVLRIPGHTKGHIAYLINNKLFCGDTLFAAGCGRAFEGTYDELYQSLMKLNALPEDTDVYCAHEYTLNNLKFAEVAEPHNEDVKNRIRFVKNLRDQGIPTVPSTLQLERLTNPFLRCDINQFAELRKRKDRF